MKKLFFSLLISCFFYSNLFANLEKQIIYSIDKQFKFIGYVIKNDDLYVKIWLDTGEGQGTIYVYKYQNKKLIEEPIDENDSNWDVIPKYFADNDIYGNKIVIDQNSYVLLIAPSEESADMYKIFQPVKENKKKNTLKGYICIVYDNYIYADSINKKIYYPGFTNKTIGIYAYDLKLNKFSELNVENKEQQDKKIYTDPIRIPNTPYLLFHTLNLGLKQIDYNSEKFEEAKGIEFWIQEIPEWKAELEAKNKENDIEVSANAEEKQEVKYIIDGPANIREKAKGKKVIGSIEDKAEVKVLNKKGDWYEVQSGDIKGWTFKDNVKEVK